jgi:signal peptidase II
MRCVLIFAGLLVAAGARSAPGQDKVVLRHGNLGGKMTISGTVEDYTGEQITIRDESGKTRRVYPGSEVIEIETTRSLPHTRGLESLADGQVEQAIAELETALKNEPRAWVRRELLATLVRSGLRRGDYASAGDRFLLLVKSDPTTRYFGIIPLIWAPESISRETREEARSWMAGTLEPGRLIGASLLADDPDWGKDARAEIKRLSSSGDPRVRMLAQVQAFRAEVAAGNLSRMQLAQWQRRVDELPEDLRAGPCYLLGRAYSVRHDYELAAATLLWVSLVDDHDFRLAARACLEAGLALDKIGQHAEANTLFSEVRVRFAGTPFADEAQSLLERAAKDDSEAAGR